MKYPNRPCSIFHINVPGHICLNTPKYKELFYCFEVGDGGTEHTHVGLRTLKPITTNRLIDKLVNKNELARWQIQVEVHCNWGTVWGYHYGFGDKNPCLPTPVWINLSDEEIENRVKDRRFHRKQTSCAQVLRQSEEFLMEKPIDSLKSGKIALPGYFNYSKSWHLAKEDEGAREDTRLELPPFLPNPWGKVFSTRIQGKRRHYWIYSKQPNKGKTTLFAIPLAEAYRCHIKTGGEFQYWNLKGNEHAIILDEYNETFIKTSSLNAMADGTAEFRKCGAPNICLNTKPLIIILSNKSIVELYSKTHELIASRFNEIEIL